MGSLLQDVLFVFETDLTIPLRIISAWNMLRGRKPQKGDTSHAPDRQRRAGW